MSAARSEMKINCEELKSAEEERKRAVVFFDSSRLILCMSSVRAFSYRTAPVQPGRHIRGLR
jgi:hypothetical protein